MQLNFTYFDQNKDIWEQYHCLLSNVDYTFVQQDLNWVKVVEEQGQDKAILVYVIENNEVLGAILVYLRVNQKTVIKEDDKS